MQRRNKRRSKTKWLRRVRMWRRSKTGWFRRLKTKKRCRLLLKDKDRFLQKLNSSMQEEDLERTKKFGSDDEHNRMKRNLYHSVTLFLSKKRRKRRINRKKPNSGFDRDATPQPRVGGGGGGGEHSGAFGLSVRKRMKLPTLVEMDLTRSHMVWLYFFLYISRNNGSRENL
ncbi:Ribosomal protein S4 mitochondrial [Bienertia sinuspersici]